MKILNIAIALGAGAATAAGLTTLLDAVTTAELGGALTGAFL